MRSGSCNREKKKEQVIFPVVTVIDKRYWEHKEIEVSIWERAGRSHKKSAKSRVSSMLDYRLPYLNLIIINIIWDFLGGQWLDSCFHYRVRGFDS